MARENNLQSPSLFERLNSTGSSGWLIQSSQPVSRWG